MCAFQGRGWVIGNYSEKPSVMEHAALVAVCGCRAGWASGRLSQFQALNIR